ncbi:MAG: aspartate--tRNA ligase [Bdellovibrionales bacterium GWA2_49_15]|nr:MAG: aspartate--tRNA ligase [Bdellovibrionales bacterium GWA2_49_15]HAZ12812.1 aspartate--tRNA ligase [Bdellovibrionales bacterium]
MGNQLKGLMRSHHCGELRKNHVGQQVVLCGWVNRYRNLGGLHFIDVRDKYGLTQLSFDEYFSHGKSPDELKEYSLESVLMAKGLVRERPASAVNSTMDTGEVEVSVTEIKILSKSDKDTIPFLPSSQIEATEDLRLKYRYLDIRAKRLQDMLALRSNLAQKTRTALLEEGFVEVETPILYKSTPEGARDYVVPSRVHPGHVYALPQSPQTLKQLLMIGGTDKYFQLCRCFRDEDLRADRQPEFTQIDIEVSFATQEYIKNLAEKMVRRLFNMPDDFSVPSITFDEAIRLYGCDKPDVRFDLKHMDVTALFATSSFETFANIAKQKGLVKAIFLSTTVGALTRKDLDELTEVVKPYGGKGVANFKVENSQFTGGISKFVTPDFHQKLEQLSSEKGNGVWLFCADANPDKAHACMDAVRRHLGTKFKMHRPGFAFLWVYDFPLLEWSAEDNRFAARHHPFTSPKSTRMDDFFSNDKEVLKALPAEAYDLVCNGYEIGGGSIRIHSNEVQSRMFEVLGMTEEETRYQFGFFIDALKFGTPPHGGMAFGFDRIVMQIAGTDSIRDVIAFPKTTSASDLMAGAPSRPSAAQTRELHFNWIEKNKT